MSTHVIMYFSKLFILKYQTRNHSSTSLTSSYSSSKSLFALGTVPVKSWLKHLLFGSLKCLYGIAWDKILRQIQQKNERHWEQAILLQPSIFCKKRKTKPKKLYFVKINTCCQNVFNRFCIGDKKYKLCLCICLYSFMPQKKFWFWIES